MNSVRASIRASQPNTLAGTITTEGDLSGTISGNVSVVINSGGPFEITLTADENGKYTSDKTGPEIVAAFDEGRPLVCTVGRNTYMPMSKYIKAAKHLYFNTFVFYSGQETEYTTVRINLNKSTNDISSIKVLDDTNGEFVFYATLVDEESGECEVDVTAEEIDTAYAAGRTMIMVYDGMRIPFTAYNFLLLGYSFRFSLEYNGACYTGIVSTNNDTVSAFVKVSLTNDFIFNLTCVDEENGVFEVDATAEDFLNAFNAGCTMVMVYEGLRCQLIGANEEGYIFYLDAVGSFVLLAVVSIIDGAISVYVDIATNEITIGEQNWPGVGTVNFTDEINKMIDNKTITDEELALLKITLI